ncbi:hypothetical protein FGO68_gene8729 [Halteria grandinella]|uniref:C2 domain-containing protein n=1 Tax=Halteria grandinella TaxID=5974 RepID=A0A8J8T3U8_HALGN|nr:hypothetical protein FGO68_gene8729 [Halteria grandinella]
MLIQCYDEDIFVDDLVGQCSFSIYELCHGLKTYASWFYIDYKGDTAGSLYLEIKSVLRLEKFGDQEYKRKSLQQGAPLLTQYSTLDQSAQNSLNQSRNSLGNRDFTKGSNTFLSKFSLESENMKASSRRSDIFAQDQQQSLKPADLRAIERQSATIVVQALEDHQIVKSRNQSNQELPNVQLASRKESRSSLVEDKQIQSMARKSDLSNKQQIKENKISEYTTQGMAQISIIKARLLNNAEFVLGKMDPYISLKCKDSTVKTRVLHECGLAPEWREDFGMRVDSTFDEITIQCFDKDILMDDLIGETTLKIYTILNKFGEDRYVSLYKNGKKTGDLLIEATFNENSTQGSSIQSSVTSSPSSQLQSPAYQRSQLQRFSPQIGIAGSHIDSVIPVAAATPQYISNKSTLMGGLQVSRNSNGISNKRSTMAMTGMATLSNTSTIQRMRLVREDLRAHV